MRFYIVFEHQVAQVLALENRRNRSRQRDRHYLPRLVVDSGFILGTETERSDRRVVVGSVGGAGPERDFERRFVNRDVERDVRDRPQDGAILAVRAVRLLHPASPNLALKYVLSRVLDARLVGDVGGRRGAQARFIRRPSNRLLQDWAERRAVQSFANAARLIDDDADRRVTIQRRGLTGSVARVSRHQDYDGLFRITVLVSLDLVRVVLERLRRRRGRRGRTAS